MRPKNKRQKGNKERKKLPTGEGGGEGNLEMKVKTAKNPKGNSKGVQSPFVVPAPFGGGQERGVR